MCVTCGNRYKAFGQGCAHAGHFIPGRNNSILIDEKFVNGQCQICNRWKRGEWVKYETKMLYWYGSEAVEEVKARSQRTKPMKAYEWEEIEEKYKKLFKELNEKNMEDTREIWSVGSLQGKGNIHAKSKK